MPRTGWLGHIRPKLTRRSSSSYKTSQGLNTVTANDLVTTAATDLLRQIDPAQVHTASSPNDAPRIWNAAVKHRPAVVVRAWAPRGVQEAIRVGTLHGAHATYEEKIKGSITAGKLADLVVLGLDPVRENLASLITIPIERTMLGGRWSYES